MKWLEKLTRWGRSDFWAQMEATESLHNAWTYLYGQYWSKASSQSRGFILPDTQEALDLLHKLGHESLERSLNL